MLFFERMISYGRVSWSIARLEIIKLDETLSSYL